MATMTHRTTFALDESTTRKIASLAKRLRVSKAEVIRLTISLAEEAFSKRDPAEALEELHRSGAGISAPSAAAYLNEVRKGRQSWR